MVKGRRFKWGKRGGRVGEEVQGRRKKVGGHLRTKCA